MKPYSATIQMKVIEQEFLLVLFVMLCQMVLAFEPVDEILKCDLSKESFRSVRPRILCNMVLVFESTDEILKCERPFESRN